MVSKNDIKQLLKKAKAIKRYIVHFDGKVEPKDIIVRSIGFNMDGLETICYEHADDYRRRCSQLNAVSQAYSTCIDGIFDSKKAAIKAAQQWKVHEAERKVEELKAELEAAKEDLEALERTMS